MRLGTSWKLGSFLLDRLALTLRPSLLGFGLAFRWGFISIFKAHLSICRAMQNMYDPESQQQQQQQQQQGGRRRGRVVVVVVVLMI